MFIPQNRRLVSIGKSSDILASTLVNHCTQRELNSIARYLSVGICKFKWDTATKIAQHCWANGIRLSMFLEIKS